MMMGILNCMWSNVVYVSIIKTDLWFTSFILMTYSSIPFTSYSIPKKDNLLLYFTDSRIFCKYTQYLLEL